MQALFKELNPYVNYLLSELVRNAIEDVFLHPVSLKLIWKKRTPLMKADFYEFYNPTDIPEDFEHTYTIAPHFESRLLNSVTQHSFANVDDLLSIIKWHTILLPFTKLHMSSTQTGNDDSRGGGCGHLELAQEDFQWKINTPEGITLQHLTEAAYRLKGSKYDYWFELCGGIHHIRAIGQFYHLDVKPI